MKALFALLIAAAALASGCLSAANLKPQSVTIPINVPMTAGVFHMANGALATATSGLVPAVGGQYSIGVASAEPTIGTTKDGSIYMTGEVPNPTCAMCPALPYANFQMGPTIMKSSDHGQTWTDVFPKLPTGDSYKLRTWDPMLHVDHDTDRIFMDDIYPLGCGFMSWSDDAGKSWMHDPESCGNPNVNDHQTVGTGKPRMMPTVGYQNLVYRCVNNGALSACAVSLNGGQTFLPQIPVAPDSGCGGITGHLEADAEGRMFLPMNCPNGEAALAMTEDDGHTWKILSISKDVPSEGLHIDIAIDEANNLYALWQSKDMEFFSASKDHGATWSKPLDVTAPGVTMTKFNAIAAGAPGKVAFAYVGTTQPNAPKLPQPTCGPLPAFPCDEPKEWANATWNGYIGIMQNALDPNPVIQTVTANDPKDPLSRGACGDRCHGMTDFLDIQIDQDGRPWASFVDVCTAKCMTDPTVPFDQDVGFAGSLVSGPALRGNMTELKAILPPPVMKMDHDHG